jgi:hypothetical protein
MNVKVTSVDCKLAELHAQTPFSARSLRQIPGPDRPDYLLAELNQPLTWRRESGDTSVTHVVLCARLVGGSIAPWATHLPINIAYVVDPTVLSDTTLDFTKCYYCAIGTADVTPL